MKMNLTEVSVGIFMFCTTTTWLAAPRRKNALFNGGTGVYSKIAALQGVH